MQNVNFTQYVRRKLLGSLTFHHVSFVVAVIVAVRGSVVDVEALDRSVVVTRRVVLAGKHTFVRRQKISGQLQPKAGPFPPAANGGPRYQHMMIALSARSPGK